MMRPEDIVFAPVILPLLGAATAFCAKAFLKGRAAKTIEYVGVFVGLALPWAVFIYTLPLVLAGQAVTGVVGSWYAGVGIQYRFDGLAWLVNMLGFSVGAAAWIYSLGGGPRGPAFSAVFLIQTAALAATIMTADLFNLFVALEVMGIASYVLVASSDKPGASLASFSYLMVSAAAMVFFLIGLYGIYRLTGSLSYTGIAAALTALPDAGGNLALVSLALIAAAVAMRVAVMPLYGWLPDAHAMAPHAISAVLSGVLIKTPLFALSRVLLLMPAGSGAGELMGYAGAVTAAAAVIIALSQKDAKRLLAYHSISQIGYIVCAWGAAVSIGTNTQAGLMLMAAAFLHAFYHALFKGLLFLSVGTTVDLAGVRDVYRLRGAAGMLRKAGEKVPVTLISFLIGALAISALPPLNGYGSKTAISYALKGTWQGVFLFAAGIGTMASFIKLSRIYWPLPGNAAIEQPESRTGLPPREKSENRWAIYASQSFLGILCIAGGIAAPAMFAFVMRLLAGTGSYMPYTLSLYSAQNLLKTLIIIVSGLLLFQLALTKPGSAVLKVVRERPRSFQGLFVSFALGTAALAAWLLYTN
jgi:formate hydrogenlyase subunit 3/multisubunit Na+/H+ antiporter MnhD subunit